MNTFSSASGTITFIDKSTFSSSTFFTLTYTHWPTHTMSLVFVTKCVASWLMRTSPRRPPTKETKAP